VHHLRALVLDVVDAGRIRDPARLGRDDSELEPQAPRSRGDCLTRYFGAGLLAAEDVHEVDQLLDLCERAHAGNTQDLVAASRPHRNAPVALLEEVTHDGVARTVGLRRRADDGDRARIRHDLRRPSRHEPQAILPSMADRLRVAAIQLNSGTEKAENIEKAERLVARAASTGADLVLLPEKWNAIGSADTLRRAAEPLEDGETVEAMRDWARTHGITIVGGSITEQREGREKLSNTSVVIDPSGDVVAAYRKIHMFDVEVGGQVYRESEVEEPGEETNLCDAEGWRVGLTVCYDLRFPELYRILALQGAELVTVPAAFTLYTGKDHWELLLRARAVENQCYVLAANEWGVHEGGKQSYGRSSIVDPWGVVLAQAPDEDCVIAAEIDKARLEQVRHDLPSLANRQPAAYRWPAGV
jgi:deaminated glutathione amidase